MNLQNDAGLPGACTSCPFNDGLTDEASQAQNYGCLPTAGDILAMKRETGQNWACHSDESRVCSGLCHSAKDAGVSLRSGGLVRYSSWYHAGAAAAVEEARSGYLVQQLSGQQFDSAVHGRSWGSAAKQDRTHHRPTVKYWHARSALQCLDNKPDGRVFFTASTAPELDPESGLMLRRFVAILEAETSPYDDTELWLKYVSVDPAHQLQGLAARLLNMYIEHARSTGQWLSVSYATEEGKAKFQDHLIRALKASGLRWTQSGN